MRAHVPVSILAMLLFGWAATATAQTNTNYERAPIGTRWLESDAGLRIKVLVEAANLGGTEVELGEITFPVGTGASPQGHMHTAVEIFYILDGEFDHIVNGAAHRLTPGMVGVVRPGDTVVHRVIGDVPVRALVIWAPGGEADRIARFFRVRPVERER